MNFCHLHAHSTYSFLDGLGTAQQIAQRVSELGHTAACITDHGNLFNVAPWEKAARKSGLHPLFGMEAYICDDVNVRPSRKDPDAKKLAHITLIAQSQEGYRNLLRLNRKGWLDYHHYKPRIDRDLLVTHQEGLVVLSGCVGGYPSQLCFHQGPEAMVEWLTWMRDRVEQFFVEYNPIPELDLSYRTLPLLARAAQELKIPAVLTADAHFPRPEDYEAQDTLLAVGTRCLKDSAGRTMKLPQYLYYCSPEELIERAVKTAPTVNATTWVQAAKKSGEIAEKCQVELPRAEPVRFWALDGAYPEKWLCEEIEHGYMRRSAKGQISDGQSDQYLERMWREYHVLCEKGFANYLLSIADVVRHVRGEGGVVICRGSAGGCLLLWLLGVSETDPIRHGLSFERFYDATRPDPPDVDLDFPQARREAAIAYVREKYGEDKVCQIAALSQIKGKAAVLDVSFALGIPRRDILPLSAAVDSAGGEMATQLEAITDPAARAILDAHPALTRLIPKVVGQYRQHSIHAAGVLVSSVPLDEVIPIVRGRENQTVAALDKRDAASAGFLKMDFLSVRALDILETCLQNTGMTFDQLAALPLDDEAALDQARRGDLGGIFQLEGMSAGPVCQAIGIDTFEDLVAASALCRPGPKEWVSLYATRKQEGWKGEGLLAEEHLVRDILLPTYGILLYQEQIMRLCREVAGLEWSDVHKIRKGVGDKDAQAFARLRQVFITGSIIRGGLSPGAASQWWHAIETHAGYSFNKSHCTTYGLIAYWFLWMKAHHPDEFYHAHLQHESDALTIKRLIREFTERGGTIDLLDPVESGVRFRLLREERRLVGGVLYLHGVGKITAQRIIDKRPGGDLAGWPYFLKQFPKAPREALHLANIDGRDPEEWDIQRMILLAPWFPVPALMRAHQELRAAQPFTRIKEAVTEPESAVCGYVTALKVTTDRILFTLEDETGGALVRVGRRDLEALYPAFAPLAVADFVILPRVKSWRGTLFIEPVPRVPPVLIWAPSPAKLAVGEGDSLKRPPVVSHEETE